MTGPVWRRLPLGRDLIDRVADRRTDPEWLAKAWVRGRVLVVGERGNVLVDERPALVLLDPADAPDGERVLLGERDGVAYFAVLATLPERTGARPAALREVGTVLGDFEAALLTEAVAVANWHHSYRFSPLTGSPLTWGAGGWEGVPADGSGVVWPRTNPAVIVLVSDGVAGPDGRCLLTRQAAWDTGRYSCVAGFVEPGESAEAAVFREVAEETAVRLDSVRYVASQPWPLPASLMLGFDALADSSQEVVPDGVEISDARWFTRAELLADEGPGTPPSLSISHELIARWRDERS